jgi:hypothetical protein
MSTWQPQKTDDTEKLERTQAKDGEKHKEFKKKIISFKTKVV